MQRASPPRRVGSRFRRDSSDPNSNPKKVLLRFTLALGFGLLALSVRADAPLWAHETSDLKPDPVVHWGRLDNGVRYAVCTNAEPTARASLRLLVLAGTVHETERQRGYAHFVEHLAFHGTRRYPGQTLHAALQRQGIARGPDVNAYTHPDRTVYRLDLSSAVPERLRDGLGVLREFADGLTFGATAVERERSVILIEKALRDNPVDRAEAALLRFLFPDSPLAETNGFGTEESVRRATAADLRAFYETWYRADHFVIVAVGAFPPTDVAREIETQFGSLPKPTPPRPAVAFGPIGNPPELRVGIEPAAEGSNAARFTLTSIAPNPPADTRASLAELLHRTIAFDAFNRRLDALQHSNADKFSQVGASLQIGPYYRQAQIRINCNQAHWRRALSTLEQELRRALEHGFTAGEIAEARAKVAAFVDYSTKAEATRLSEFEADSLVESIAENRVFIAPATLTSLSVEALAAATPETCLAAFRDAWGPGHPQLFVSANFSGKPGADDLAAVYRRSARKRVRPPATPPPVVFAYRDFGPPGEIAERRHIADLDLHCVRFANGVLLNLKSTPFEANRIVYGARLGSGAAGEPRRLPGLRYFADAGLGLLGLRQHDQLELDRLAAGHLASLSFSAGEDAFYLSGLSDTAGAERLLQLLAAHLSDPGWRKAELPAIRQRMFARIEEITNNPTSYLNSQRHARLARLDGRYSLPATEELARYSLGDLRDWIEPQLENAPLEIGVVGDFDVEQMIQLARHTVGCLPRRESPRPTPRVSFTPVLPPTPVPTPAASRHGAVQIAWAIPPTHALRAEHQLELLGEVLRNRLVVHIRGELGATYSSSCQVWRSELQRETGYLIASLNCAPADAERVATAARELAAALAREGVTAEEFERARQPRLQNTPTQLRSNSYWLATAVATAQSRPDQLDWPRRRIALLEQITPGELSVLAASVLPAERASVFTTTLAE